MSVRIARHAAATAAIIAAVVLVTTLFGAVSAGGEPNAAPSGSSAIPTSSGELTLLGVPLSMAIWISVGVLAMVGAAIASRGDRRSSTAAATDESAA